MNQAIALERDPARRQQLLEAYQSVIPPKAVESKEAYDLAQVNYRTDQRLYPIPQQGSLNWGVKDNVAFTPRAQAAIDQRTQQLQMQSPYLRNNPSLAHERAVQSLQNEGVLPTQAQVNEQRKPTRTKITSVGTAGDDRITTFQAPGANTATDHMIVDVLNAGPAPAPAPATTGSSVSSAFNPPAGGGAGSSYQTPEASWLTPSSGGASAAPGPTPPGSLGPAPPGIPNGKVGTVPQTGQRAIVVNGFMYAIPGQ